MIIKDFFLIKGNELSWGRGDLKDKRSDNSHTVWVEASVLGPFLEQAQIRDTDLS